MFMQKDQQSGNTIPRESSKDFVMYVGGPVWALDWCPTFHHKPDCDIKSEFIAVAAHAPESSYHKIGAPLTGRGLIQIWCLLNFSVKEENVPSQVKKMPKKSPSQSTQPQKQRGRPRKTPVSESEDSLDINSQHVEAAAVQFLDDLSEMVPTNELFAKRYSVRKRKSSGLVVSAEANQNSSDSETLEVKSPQPKKARGRPKKKPRDEPEGQYVQALAVQSPENSSSLTRKNKILGTINGQVAVRESVKNKKDSGQVVTAQSNQNPSSSEIIEVKSLKPKKARGRSKQKTRDVPEGQYMQALAVQSSSLIPINEVSGIIQEQVVKRGSARKQKGSSQVITAEPKQNPSDNETEEVKSPQPKKTRGRPKKMPRDESENQYVQALAVQFPENMLPTNEVSETINERVAKKESHRKQKSSRLGVTENSALTVSTPRIFRNNNWRRAKFHQNDLPLLTKDENSESSLVNLEVSSSCGEDPVGQLSENITRNGPLEMSPARSSTPKDVVLPRAVLCLAHNGKVAWDVKWRPSDSYDTKSKHRMGYLAVLLGNGALEVWEVPSPHAVRVIYSASRKEGTDPRFVKLDPVFRCSMLKCGDRQSMPLTVEWSASPAHDLILAGCHDGVVALWKFSANVSPKDTRPLLCFSADTVPIRALAWAPIQSDPESANVFVTGGHKGLKFWDMRDPFHPLWDLNPVQRVICSLDWLPDPRCIIISYDDGTIRILSLSKAAYDVPVTGKPFVGTQQQGLHSYYCSSYTIWSIQVSRLTGMVAYCSADGTVLRFQLTTRAVEKDPLRNRAPHFLCGSLTEEESTLTMYTPFPDVPFPMKKSLNEWANAPRTIRGFLSVSNQEKRAKEEMAKGQASNQQPLALCYGDDPGIDSGSEDMMAAEKSKKASKSKTSSKKQPKADQSLVCRADDPEPVRREDNEKVDIGDEIELLPPKIIAMHRVRWNMNKGSERWLCYGGASGILRCQEINPSGP